MARAHTQKPKKDKVQQEGYLRKVKTPGHSSSKRHYNDTVLPGSIGNDSITELLQRQEHSGEAIGSQDQDARLLAAFDEKTQGGWSRELGIRGFLTQAKALVRSLLNRNDGQPLNSKTRSAMEARFSQDFSNVRVHTDNAAQTVAQKLGAKAFTSGQHIWFGKNHGPEDTKLLSHELMHAIQQQSGNADELKGEEQNLAKRETLEAEAKAASNPTSQTFSKLSNNSSSPTSLLPGAIGGSSPAVVQFDFEEDVLRELRRMPSAEAEGISEQERGRRASALTARRQRLRELFRSVPSREAARLYERLSARRRGDRLSERFHHILATPTRQELLGILRVKMQAPEESSRAGEGPALGEVIGESATVEIEGDPARHSSFIDNAVVGAGLENLGGRFLLYQRVENGRGVDGIPLDRNIVHLQDDPLADQSGSLDLVYSSRAAAEAALSGIGVENMYTYYLEGGIIYPTIFSETTTPRIIDTLRRVREWEREQARAMRDLSVNLLLWYVGARLPVRTSRGTTARAAAAAAAGEVVGPLGRLTQAEIQQAIQASGGRTVELFTKLTQAPVAGRPISFATERALAEAARTQGRVFVVRVPDVLFRRLEMIGVLQRSQTLMGGTVGTEIRALEQVSELLIRFLVP